MAWARNIKLDIVALWIAARDRRVPWYTKLAAGCVAAYALSPIDLIPDFVPVLGYLDDVILVPLGIMLAVRLVPVSLMTEFRAISAASHERPMSKVGLGMIVTLWLSAAALLTWAWLRNF